LNQGPNEIELHWCGETSTAEFRHAMVVRTTTSLPQYDRSVVLRALCHYLLTKLPEDGLPDVCRSIVEAYEYYLQPPRILRMPEHQAVKAKSGRTYQRPSFPIAEE
jgi:hypothetical protein